MYGMLRLAVVLAVVVYLSGCTVVFIRHPMGDAHVEIKKERQIVLHDPKASFSTSVSGGASSSTGGIE